MNVKPQRMERRRRKDLHVDRRAVAPEVRYLIDLSILPLDI